MLCFLKYGLNAIFARAYLSRKKKGESERLRCFFQPRGKKDSLLA